MHRLPPQVKIASLVLFVLAVVATPREAFWAYGLFAATLVGVMVLAELPPKRVMKRMLIEVPFVAFALLLPFFGGGERIEFLGVAVSREGLWGAWTILAKATLGVAASVVLSATTTVPDILSGLDRLRAPRVVTAVAGFMVRYLDVVLSEVDRRRVAMAARGYEPRWVWQNRALAASAGALFIRSYERGERVYQSMVARGYRGQMPRLSQEGASVSQWVGGLMVAATAWSIALLAWTVLR